MGIALAENRKKRKQIGSYPVVAVGEEDILQYVQNAWVDEIVVKITRESYYPGSVMEKFEEMGIVVHQCLNIKSDDSVMNYAVEKFWGYTVITSFIHSATPR